MRNAEKEAEDRLDQAKQQAKEVKEAADKVKQETDEVIANTKKEAEAEVRAKLHITDEILEGYGLLGELQTDNERWSSFE